MTLVDDVEEHVGGVVAVREVADLVDDEHVRFEVARERFAKPTVTTRAREVGYEFRAVHEERVETILHRPVREGDRQVRLAAAGLADFITEWPSVMKSGVSSEPIVVSGSVDWY